MASSRRSLRAVPTSDTFALMLSAKRRDRDQTQAAVAELIGVRQQTVAAWERGDRPQPRFYAALADYLELESEADLRELLRLVPATASEGGAAGVRVQRDPRALYDAIAASLAERISIAPMSKDEVALFQRLLDRYEPGDAVDE